VSLGGTWGCRVGGSGSTGPGCSGRASTEGRVDVAKLDVGVDHLCIGVRRFNVFGITRSSHTGATSGTRAGRVGGVGAVEP